MNSEKEKNCFQIVYDAVKQIPKGMVASYGTVAKMTGGRVSNARVVGFALHVNPDPTNIPCHRVVTVDGRCSTAFAFGGINAQEDKLKAEGVEIEDRIVPKKYFFTPLK